MNYQETEQKILLREMEQELLAVLVIDLNSEDFEVIYTNGGYRNYGNRFTGQHFFSYWRKTGLNKIYEEDRVRMKKEISRENLTEVFGREERFITRCRFMVQGKPTWCRIKVIRNTLDPETVVFGIKNVDQEIRMDMERMADMVELLRRDRDIQELKEIVDRLRMKRFSSRMHPHFLYNALSSIREIVLTDPEYGADMLYDFTTYLRAGIRAMAHADPIPFSEELKSIKAYIRIEEMRMGERLKVEYDIRTDDFLIIPLSVQPIVENAVKHGVYEKGPDGGTVRICTSETADYHEIRVEDDGVGFDPEEIIKDVREERRDSTGCVNQIIRLEKMMGAEVQLDSRIGEGTTAVIRIPKKTVIC